VTKFREKRKEIGRESIVLKDLKKREVKLNTTKICII
jgi:hypothetical protein